VDFTGLAEAYGFERQPALINWRSFYPGARFNEFAFTEGLDWRSAMLQLYPAEAIATPTAFSSPTPTPTNTRWPTPTPWWLRWRTPTPVPPTITPIPSATIALSP
jgi:TolB protein